MFLITRQVIGNQVKRFFQILLGLLLFLLLLVGGGMLWLTHAGLKDLAAKVASDALDRPVLAQSLTVAWGNPLHLELTNLRIANAAWGSTPHMITLARFSADIDLSSLWIGKPIYDHLRAEGLTVVLERDPKGKGNWKFGDGSAQGGGFALIPKNRTQFPTLLDMALKDALITYRTYSGNVLRIELDNVTIVSAGEDVPVTLKAAGAYNNTPLALDARTESFDKLREATIPFGTAFALFGKTARLEFDGTMLEPLDFEGVDGALKLTAEELDNLLASFNADMTAAYPLIVNGRLTRKGDHWELTKAVGKLDQGSFDGQLILDEGSKGAPDRIAADLSFDKLDFDRLLVADKTAASKPISLTAPNDPGIILDAKIKTQQFLYDEIRLSDVTVAGRVAPGKMALTDLRFPYAGGRISASAVVADEVVAEASVEDISADRLAREFGAAAGDVTGKLDGRLVVTMRGETIDTALQHSSGAAVFSMTDGSIKRAIIEQVSTDIRSLFRRKEGSAPIKCLGGILVLKDGIATLAPFRLQAKGASVQGGGTIDLRQGKLDLTAKSDRKSTGFFALDLPVRVSGTFDNITAGIASDAEATWAPPAAPSPATMAAPIRDLAARNPCLN